MSISHHSKELCKVTNKNKEFYLAHSLGDAKGPGRVAQALLRASFGSPRDGCHWWEHVKERGRISKAETKEKVRGYLFS